MQFTTSSITFALVAGLAACAGPDNPSQPDPASQLDAMRFRCKVEPILARNCSYTGCHGNAAFPFRIYSAGKLRDHQAANIDELIMPLSAAEHTANFEPAAGFAFEGVRPDDNLLLKKNIPAEKGGFEHVGGVIFSGPDDAQYAAIRDWLAGGTGCPP